LLAVTCDDIQVVPPGSGVPNANAVVVVQGPVSRSLDAPLATPASGSDVVFTGGDGHAASLVVGDDVEAVGVGESVRQGAGANAPCVDGSRFALGGFAGLAERFVLCSIAKPGPNGSLESRPSGDDALVPAGYGQKFETTDPLNPDSDQDDVRDGVERHFGSSPNDPGDTGVSGDLDRDGLSDNQESAGWLVTNYGPSGAA